MKSFFKSLLASIIGCTLVLGTLFLGFMIFMFAIIGASLSAEEKNIVKDNSVLTLTLSGILSDRVEKNSLLEMLDSENTEARTSLIDILDAIDIAKYDDKIKGIYIKAGAFSASSASLKEIREALINFKEESNKFVVAYGDFYTQGCYYVASVADEVFLNPEGGVDIHGYSSSPMFYKGLLEKVGVEMQIFKVGTFKSAVEPYINTQMSAPNREQISSYINDMWKTFAEDVSESRGLSVDKIDSIANYSPMLKDNKYILDNNLIDGFEYESFMDVYLNLNVALLDEAIRSRLAKNEETTNKDSIPNVISSATIEELPKDDDATDEIDSLSRKKEENTKAINKGKEYVFYVNYITPTFLVNSTSNKPSSKSSDMVAVLYAEGSITSGSGRDGITDKRYIKELKKLQDDKNIKAVVFRINSPGGSAFASEQIWKAVADLKEKKPIVVSMGDVAASGGYYIAANASAIYAQPNTVTGSIGIFGMFPNVAGLTDKIGVSFDNVKTHELADFGNITRPMRDNEKLIVQNYVERGYKLFLKRCADGRGLTTDSIDAIGQGRVWTGNQALEIGLIDAIGGIDDAIDEAARLAELDNFSTVSYPKKIDFWKAFLETNRNQFASQIVKDYLGIDYKAFELMREIKQQDYLQARMPYDTNIE